MSSVKRAAAEGTIASCSSVGALSKRENFLTVLSILQKKGRGSILPSLHDHELVPLSKVCKATFVYTYFFLKARKVIHSQKQIYRTLDLKKIKSCFPDPQAKLSPGKSYRFTSPSGELSLVLSIKADWAQSNTYVFTNQTKNVGSGLPRHKEVFFPYVKYAQGV